MMMNLTKNNLHAPAPSAAATSTNMAQALQLVRAGKLLEASDLLMGKSGPGTAAIDAEAPPNPQHPEHPAAPPSATHFTDLMGRGMAGVQDMLDALDTQGKAGFTLPQGVGMPAGFAGFPAQGGATRTPRADEPGSFERVAFQQGGFDHPYFLYTPSTPAPAAGRALVLMLHGCTQDAQDFACGTRMNVAAEAAGALVLYPTQDHSANANGCWNWFRPQDQHAGSGEPALLMSMVQHAIAAHAVDTTRVYVAGLSAGGAMAAVLAEQYPNMFAAVGVHSGLAAGAADNMMGALSAMKSGAKGWSAAPTPGAKPVPLIVFHGDADATVHPRNGEQLMQGAAAGVATSAQTEEQGTSADGQRYTRTSVVDPAAPGTVLVEHWLLSGAGHAWSGGSAQGSHTSAKGVDASAEMLRFFLSHSTAD